MNLSGRLAYGALLCPAGVHVISYLRTPRGLKLRSYARSLRSLTEAEAAVALADLLEANGARGHRVAIGVSGFGTCHQLLTLPPADREILRPIVTRELRRFFPYLFPDDGAEPIVEFVDVTAPEAPDVPRKDLLVGAVPPMLLSSVADELTARGIELDHWTIMPRSVQRLVDAYADPSETSAALVMVPGWPVFALFHEGEIRLFSEPRTSVGSGGDSDLDAVLTHVERGSVFLRQQFDGAAMRHIYIAAGSEPSLMGADDLLEGRLSLPVNPLGPRDMSPGALAAFGVALDASSANGLNLLPESRRPVPAALIWTRRLITAAAAVLILGTGWWALQARGRAEAAESRLEAVARTLTNRSSELDAIEPVIAARQAHTQRTLLLQLLARDSRRLPELLWPVQSAAPEVTVESLAISRQPEGWNVSLALISRAWNYDAATDAITRLTTQLGSQLPPEALSVSGIVLDRNLSADSTALGEGGPTVAARVQMAFVVPAESETAE